MSETVSVSRVLNRIADMIDCGMATHARIELIDVDPAVVSVSRIAEPFTCEKLMQYRFEVTITTTGAALKQVVQA